MRACGATCPCLSRLNEGLPQKGKRFGSPEVFCEIGAASMKGFPRRGSDLPEVREGG